jgi:hypothetical protein
VVLLVGVGQRVKVLLRGLNLRVTHPIHYAFEVCTAREKPRRVRMGRSCTRTPKSMPDALTAGSHTRVPNVLRECRRPAGPGLSREPQYAATRKAISQGL